MDIFVFFRSLSRLWLLFSIIISLLSFWISRNWDFSGAIEEMEKHEPKHNIHNDFKVASSRNDETEPKLSVSKKLKSVGNCVRVVVPFIAEQSFFVESYLSSWKNPKMPACNNTKSSCIFLHLLLDFSQQVENREAKYISYMVHSALKEVKELEVNSCVKGYSFSVFQSEIDNYWAGSFLTLKHLLWETYTLGYGCMAIMELDVFPIKAGWLDTIHEMCYLDGNFLIKGTAFTNVPINTPSYGHINGNCVWNVQNSSWAILNESLNILEDHKHLLEYLPTGYNALIYHMFVGNDKIFEKNMKGSIIQKEIWQYYSRWRTTMQAIYEGIHPLSLSKFWSQGYNQTSFIVNADSFLRPECSALTPEFLLQVEKSHPNSVFVHCSQRKLKDEVKNCIQAIVPFTISEIWNILRLLSWLVAVNPCGSRSEVCFHFQFIIKTKAGMNVNEEDFYLLSSMIDHILKRVRCIHYNSISIKTFEEEEEYTPYALLKEMVRNSHSIGYKYIFMMEPHVLPLQPAWLETLYIFSYTKKHYFDGLKGTAVKSVPKHHPAFGVINRNCLWNVENIDFLENTFKQLDQFQYLIKDLPTNYDILFRHIFFRPPNAVFMQNYNDDSTRNWLKALNQVYKVFGNNPLTRNWSKPSTYDRRDNFLLIDPFQAMPFCANQSANDYGISALDSEKNWLESNPNFILVLCELWDGISQYS